MILNVVFTCIFCFFIGMVIVNFFADSGLKMPQNSVFEWITNRKINYNGEIVNNKEMGYVFITAIAFRIVIYLISIFAIKLFMDNSSSFNAATFFTSWERWDALHYLKLAELGYMKYTENGQHLFLVFFPLYPFLVKIIKTITGNYDVAAMIVSTLCYGGGCCFLYKLVAEDYNKSIAKKTVVYLSVFPFAFFFGGVMTESTFFFTAVACLYFIRKHKWILAALFGILATLARMTGIILVVVAAIEFCIYYKPILLIRQKKYKELWRLIYTKAIFIPFISVGTMVYLYLNYAVEGDPFRFLYYQKIHWSNGSQYFTKTINLIFTNAFSGDNSNDFKAALWIPAILLFFIAVAIIIYGIRRHSVTYLSFLIIYLLINYSLIWPISEPRYMSCAIPMFIMFAEFSEKYKKTDRWITVVSSVFMGMYMAGYLICKAIM